jgi:hypothetical protein
MPDNEKTESPDRSHSGPFAVLIAKEAKGCWIGYGSVLFLEFGELQLDEKLGRQAGEFTLWCDRILWRIEQGDRVLAGCEDDGGVMENAIEQINGRTLVSGQISQSTGDSLIEFTDHIVLRTFVPTSEEDARWNFRKRGVGYSLLGPTLAPCIEASGAPPPEANPRPQQ